MDNATYYRWYMAHDQEFVAFMFCGWVISANADLLATRPSDGLLNVSNLKDPELDRLIDA